MFHGNTSALFDLGSQLCLWAENIPNQGLLRFHAYLGTEFLVVTSVEGLNDILGRRTYDFVKPRAFQTWWKRFLGQGLMAEEGDVHKEKRRLVRPVFMSKRVDDLKPLITSKAVKMATRLLQKQSIPYISGTVQSPTPEGLVIDVYELASYIVMDIVCIIGLGMDYDVANNTTHVLLKHQQTVLTYDEKKLSQYKYHLAVPGSLLRLCPSAVEKSMDAAYASARMFVANLARERAEDIKTQSLVKFDYLTLLVQSGLYTAEECAADILSIMTAG